ncbi:MAG: hypothetical protein KJ556_21075, partial [Gammaproteobacteria bacterium]|nr:hypothetical protein [Gammaproteobacteria bacterium]
ELGRRENKGNIILTDCDRVLEVLDELTNNRKMTKYCIDFETIGLDIFSDKFKVLTVGISKNKRKAYCIPIEFPADDEINWSGWNEDERQLVMDKLIEFFENPKMKIAQNKKFENMIIQKHFGVRPRNLSFDTMNATQALDSRGVTKLDVQTFFLTGKTYSDEVDVKRLNEFPLKTVAKYNCLDAKYPLIIMDKQCKSASTKQLLGINLLNNGADLFADMEMRGIGIDLDEVDRQIDWVDEEINTLDNYFLDSPFSLKYKKKNGKDINVGSTVQLQDLFYGIMGLNPVGNKSSAGKYSLDIKHLEELKTTIRDDELIKYVDGILRQRRLVKHKSTYLESWKEKSINGILHPSYGFFTETMRSNSENPNFQNIPERDEELKRIKKCIIPHLGDEFLEGDFKALEVCVIAMLSKDEVLINKIRNNVDFHREWAAKIFDKREEDITDEERFRVKNSFVFALFYGSWYESVYKDFVKFGFTDIPLKHFRRMEKELWKTFNGVKRWQNKEIDNYNRHGYVVMKTGFRRHGPLSLNKIINTPVQGTAFHLLLTSLIEMNKIMVGDRMKSGIVAETHDSVVIDTKREEREDVLALANKEMTKKRFKWMCVPLTISWQLGSNLFDMNKIKGAVNE